MLFVSDIVLPPFLQAKSDLFRQELLKYHIADVTDNI